MKQRYTLTLGVVGAMIVGVLMPSQAMAKERATFTKDVLPIMQENCQGCHRPGQIAPFSLMSYQEARPWAKSIKKYVASRKMPPYFAHPSSLPMKNDMNLTDAEITTIVNWVDQGAPKGNPSDAPEPRVFAAYEGGWMLGEPDLVLKPMEPFKVDAGVDDLYQCFQIPLNLDHDVWLKGAEFQPDNNNVVHHFILFEDKVGKVKSLDEATPEPGCECSDMEKVLIGTNLLKMWAPGNVQPLTEKGVANKIGKGHNLILQVHYHNTTGEAQWDQSQFALHIAQPDELIQKQIRMQLVVQPNLNIKAGDPNSKHAARYVTRQDITLYSSGVHMHYRGKDMGMWAKRPGDTKETTIVWVPHFDFNWQLTYEFAETWKAPKGTEFTMRCTHDNSEDNPFNPDPTRDIHWGLGSVDEMAFSGYSYTLDSEALNVTPVALDPRHGQETDD